MNTNQQQPNDMQQYTTQADKFEKFVMEDKVYSLPVVDSINLTEEQPDEALISKLAQKEVLGEKGILIKRIIGTILYIVAISQIIGVFVNMFSGYYKSPFDFNFIMHMVIFLVLVVLASILFHRNKAVSPIPAFRKYWGSYFATPDDDNPIKITPSSNIVGIFHPLTVVVKKLQLFYPVSLEIDEEKIVQFVAKMAEIIDKHYADLPPDNEAAGVESTYGVAGPQNANSFVVSTINETLQSVDGSMNIFKFYRQGKTIKGNCIKLNIRTYIVKLGKYWAPANPVPKFAKLNWK